MKLGKWFCHHNVRLVKPDRSINYLTFKGQLNFSKILTPGQGQLIPNWVMLHVKWLLSVRRIEWCHFYSKTFCQPLWPWLDPKVILEVGSLRLTWWPDLRWPGSKIFREGGERMPGKVYQKWRRCAPPFLRYLKKTAGGGGCSNASRTKYRIAKYRIAKYRKQYIERQNIEVAKYRMRKISMGQNIEIAKYRIAKYRIAKYRKCKISKCKISKAQNIERQNIESKISMWRNIEVAKYRKTKYRSGKISKDKISKWQNIESKISKWQNIERKISKW